MGQNSNVRILVGDPVPGANTIELRDGWQVTHRCHDGGYHDLDWDLYDQTGAFVCPFCDYPVWYLDAPGVDMVLVTARRYVIHEEPW